MYGWGWGYAFPGVRGRRTNGPILHGGRRGCVCTEGGGAVQGQRTGGAVHARRLAGSCLAGGSVGSCMHDMFFCDMRLPRQASVFAVVTASFPTNTIGRVRLGCPSDKYSGRRVSVVGWLLRE